MQNYSKAYILFNYACVAASYVMLSLPLFLMDEPLATKGYVGMGILLLTGSLVTLVKLEQDKRIAEQTSAKIEAAKQEKLLNEYAATT